MLLSSTLLSAQGTQQAPVQMQGSPAASDFSEPIKQARQLNSEGKQSEAIDAYNKIINSGSGKDLYDAQIGIGNALDLQGKYEEARKHLSKAIEIAPAELRIQALKAMAFSYAFQRNAKEAAKFEMQAFNMQMKDNKFIDAAGTANELARIQLESGDIDDAYRSYKSGYDTANKAPDLKPADKDLWDFRWEHALARIAARRGNKFEAQKHVAAAKAALDKMNNSNQAVFYPYLTGYVAFYTGDMKSAIADLQQADQKDPFILTLLAQAYDKTGDHDKAMDLYRKVLAINTHNPTNAFARPIAKKALGTSSAAVGKC